MAIQTKCKGCGTISPLRTDVCDKCGGMSFVPFEDGETRTVKQIMVAKSNEVEVEKQKIQVAKKESVEKVKTETKIEEPAKEIKKEKKESKKEK